MHPTWSLPFFVVFLLCLNAILAFAHLWTPPSQTLTGESIFIDFVGQSAIPGRLHMLCIDGLVCFAQLLMTVIAFETGKDDLRPEGEASALDDLTSMLEEEDVGQGFDVRDEEAALFGLDEEEERKRQKTSLTHHIAVVRLRPIYDQILSRQFLPTPPSGEANAAADDAPPPTEEATSSIANLDRPDTSRIRRFSRRTRDGVPVNNVAAQEAPTNVGLGPVSADDSWPPMWLIIARNMVGGSQPRLPSFRPMQGLASIRNNITGRFGRSLSHAPTTDRSQYTRINPDAPPDA